MTSLLYRAYERRPERAVHIPFCSPFTRVTRHAETRRRLLISCCRNLAVWRHQSGTIICPTQIFSPADRRRRRLARGRRRALGPAARADGPLPPRGQFLPLMGGRRPGAAAAGWHAVYRALPSHAGAPIDSAGRVPLRPRARSAAARPPGLISASGRASGDGTTRRDIPPSSDGSRADRVPMDGSPGLVRCWALSAKIGWGYRWNPRTPNLDLLFYLIFMLPFL